MFQSLFLALWMEAMKPYFPQPVKPSADKK